MKNNPIQFAVVREDPLVEERIVRQYNPKKVLLIGSGGCTALHLKTVFPDLFVSIIDMNKSQIDLINKKKNLLNNTYSLTDFNVESSNPGGLNACGNFESLFSMWRLFINEFVATKDDLMDVLFSNKNPDFIFSNPYWKASFDLFFGDSMLITMFTKNAIQHAPSGSYPKYFKDVFEKGINRNDKSQNYFLHHILFGHYLKNAYPLYLDKDHTYKIKIDNMQIISAEDFENFEEYDLVSFSNIFDWMPPSNSNVILQKIAKKLRPGCCFLLRQLNNGRDYNHEALEKKSIDYDADRSLFYNKITLYQKGRIL